MDQRTNIVIVGAGGLGRETLSTIRACNVAKDEWDVLGFLDSDPGLKGANVGGIPVLGNDSWIRENSHKPARFICAIGNPNLRLQVVEKLRTMDCKFASIIDPDVRIPDSIQIGAGTVIMGGTRFTTDAKIGSHVVIYMNCSITHDVCVGDFCLIPSGCNLSGGCVLEPGVQLGTGVSILPLRRVGAWSIIGAGSVVTDDIPSKSTAVGIPCRVIK